MNLNRFTTISLLSIILIFSIGCEETTEPKASPAVTVHLLETAVNEAWLGLTFVDAQKHHKIKIFRDQNKIAEFFYRSDTVFYDSTLTINTPYTYSVEISDLPEMKLYDKTEINITTLDTTSHDINWKFWVFGNGGASSTLNGVSVIENNNVWVVGYIYEKNNDSLLTYNAAQWTGSNSLTIYEIPSKNSPSSNGTSINELKHVIGFSSDSIFAATSLQVQHFSNDKWKDWVFYKGINDSVTGNINHYWGRDINNVWGVGTKGLMIYYDGRSIDKTVISGDIYFTDIYGAQTMVGTQILLPYYYHDYNNPLIGGIKLLDENGNLREFPSLSEYSHHSVWFKTLNNVFVSGHNNIAKFNGQYWKEFKGLPDAAWIKIRGSAPNNIFAIDAFGKIAHYNGKNWDVFQFMFPIHFRAIDVKGSVVAVAGFYNKRGYIFIGNPN